MNWLDIWITLIQKSQNFVEFRPLKAELLLRQRVSSAAHLNGSARKVCVCGLLGKNGWHRAGEPWIWTSFLKLKSSTIAFSFAWFFSFFFNDPFLLFILARVAANHKTTTESDKLNKIAGVLKYAHQKIGAGVVERW